MKVIASKLQGNMLVRVPAGNGPCSFPLSFPVSHPLSFPLSGTVEDEPEPEEE